MAPKKRKTESTPDAQVPTGITGPVRAYSYRALSNLPPSIKKGEPVVKLTVIVTAEEARRINLFAAWHNLSAGQLLRHYAVQSTPQLTLAVPAEPTAQESSESIRQRFLDQSAANVDAFRKGVEDRENAA